MTIHSFVVDLRIELTVSLEDDVVNVIDDPDWHEAFYDLNTPKEIAGHIAYNYVVNRRNLSQLDGWADQPDSNARVRLLDVHIDTDEYK